MITLTNKIYLPEYQIKQAREVFTKARVVPRDEDIVEVLKKNFPDLM